MNTLIHRVLLGVLVLQIILAALLWWPRSGEMAAEPLLDIADASAVVAMRVSDAAGSEVRLARIETGWALPEADDYPIDTARVDAALAGLLSLTHGSTVTETAASHERLQVANDAFVRRVVLELADGATRMLYLGASPALSDSYVRIDGQDQVYRGRGVSSWDWGATPSGWIDTLYMTTPLEDVSALHIVNSNDDLVLERREDGGWALQGDDDPVDASAVNALAQRAISVRMAEPLGKDNLPAYGLDAPLCTVSITTNNGETQLVIGAAHARGGFVVKASTAEYYVRVADYAVESLIEATVESLRPESTPAAPAAAE